MDLQPVEIGKLMPEMVQVFGERNALLTAGDLAACNTMTIGWCQLGYLWARPVCTVYVRPERYTYQFMENNGFFTVSVMPEDRKEVLAYCGVKSGRDVNKFEECGLHVLSGPGGAPVIEEAEWVLVCSKIYVQDMDAESLRDGSISDFYGVKGGWHRIYTGEVIAAYRRGEPEE